MVKQTKLPIHGWEWIFYIWGWVTGVFSVAFWVILIILHLVKNQGQPFFGPYFHRRVFVWGVAMGIFAVLVLLFVLLFMSAMFRAL